MTVKEKSDNKKNVTYKEYEDGYWERFEYDSLGNMIYTENSNGIWELYEFEDEKLTYWESNSYEDIAKNKKWLLEISHIYDFTERE